MQRRRALTLVAAGAFVGAVCRHLLAVAAPLSTAWVPGTLPWGTLAANALGAFALGALTARERSRAVSLALGTGFCSSFTTYSTFAVETVALGTTGAALYVVGTYALGLLAVVAGRRVAGERPTGGAR
ncbi:fluoride efflux transporter FluC [Halomarina rubra]|uniref:Fluoride-specific ion channel FluC n=1 Tax=Halomarina rubra TaxID=2071873 RepID=A0ABD6AQ58_9EURY|nr:CrcB family protein [Halomarina rubra]